MATKNVVLLSTQQILNREVNVYGDFENPLFLAKDVAEWIDYAKTSKGAYNVSMMLQTVDDDEKLVSTMLVSGQNREVLMLTENGLYEVLMQSRKPITKEFKKEVKVMLNTIRRHGIYATPEKLYELLAKPESMVIVLTELQKEQTLRRDAEKQIRELRPKAELMEKVLDCDEMIDIGQTAKILELPFGRNTLFVKLREKGIFFKHRNEPKQEYIDKGYFTLKEKVIEPNNHDSFTVVKTLVTQRGLEFIARLFNVVATETETPCE